MRPIEYHETAEVVRGEMLPRLRSARNLASQYRADIDGLRAIAVLCVIGFHAFPDVVRGGFVGVDIFFVISGYLITKIILENLGCGSFSFVEFYVHRIKRIFPALLAVLIACLTFGLLALLPWQFDELAKNVAAGAAFISNIILWQQSGYFDTAAASKPLLHLWSLGVEEQYYVIWPFLLWLSSKWRISPLQTVLAVGLISFALNIWQVQSDPVAAFYLPQTRLWELAIGSCLACLMCNRRDMPNITNSDVRSYVGAALIVVSVLLLNQDRTFPGWWALIPTIGTVLIISAGPHALLNSTVLSSRALVWLGLISYPVYLWHWPLLSFPNIVDMAPPSLGLRIGAVLASILLGWLTYTFIEKPIRYGRRPHFAAATAFASMAVVGVSALLLSAMAPSAFSVPSMQKKLLSELGKVSAMKAEHESGKLYGKQPCFQYLKMQTVKMFVDNKCVDIKYPGRPTVFLVGDSHSASLSLGLRPWLDAHKVNFLQVSTGYCKPTSHGENEYVGQAVCKAINDLVLDKIASIKPDVVIIDCYWVSAATIPWFRSNGDFMNTLLDTLHVLKERGAKKIIVMGEIPTWPSLPDFLAKQFVKQGRPIPTRTYEGVYPESLEMDARMNAAHFPEGVTYLSLKNAFCNTTGCLTAVGPDLAKDVIVWDYGHFTVAGSKYVADTFLGPILTKLLRF